MRYDALIFDIDGTLWDASQTSSEGWNNGLTTLNIPKRISASELRSVKGQPYETCIDLLLPGLRAQHSELLSTLNDSEMTAIKKKGGAFYKGAIEGLKELSKEYKLYIISNCQQWYLELFLEFSNTREILSGWDCHGASGLSKGEMIRRLIICHGLKNPTYIGDTEGDEAAARSACIDFIHVSWGFGKSMGGCRSMGTFSELVRYLHTLLVKEKNK
jgi:phosphoglycolate phosphatase